MTDDFFDQDAELVARLGSVHLAKDLDDETVLLLGRAGGTIDRLRSALARLTSSPAPVVMTPDQKVEWLEIADDIEQESTSSYGPKSSRPGLRVSSAAASAIRAMVAEIEKLKADHADLFDQFNTVYTESALYADNQKLMAQCNAMNAAIARKDEALRFYADAKNYAAQDDPCRPGFSRSAPVISDAGAIARAALEERQ